MTRVLLTKFEEWNQEDPIEAVRESINLGHRAGQSIESSSVEREVSPAQSRSFKYEDEFAVSGYGSTYSESALASEGGKRRPRVPRRAQLGPITGGADPLVSVAGYASIDHVSALQLVWAPVGC